MKLYYLNYQLFNLIVAQRHFFKRAHKEFFKIFLFSFSDVKKTVENIIQLDISNSSAGAFVFYAKVQKTQKKNLKTS